MMNRGIMENWKFEKINMQKISVNFVAIHNFFFLNQLIFLHFLKISL